MLLPSRTGILVLALGACGSIALLAAPSAGARTVHITSRATIALVGTRAGHFRFSGPVTDRALGDGGMLLKVHRTSGGLAGTATIIDGLGSLKGKVRMRTTGHTSVTAHEKVTVAVTKASGAFTGARGTLTGRATIRNSSPAGVMRLRGTLRGARGRAPTPPPGTHTHRLNGRFGLAELSVNLKQSNRARAIGSGTGAVRGPTVLVVNERSTKTGVHGTFTLFAAGGSLTGAINWREKAPGTGSGRGSARITGGTGDLTGAHSSSAATIIVGRNQQLQIVILRIRGAFTL